MSNKVQKAVNKTIKSIHTALAAVRLAGGDLTAAFTLVRNSKLVRIVVISISALLMAIMIGIAVAPIIIAEAIKEKVVSMFSFLNPAYQATVEQYMDLSYQSIVPGDSQQIPYLLNYKVIAAVDQILYGGESTKTQKRQIVNGFKPEFIYKEMDVEVFKKTVSILDSDGTVFGERDFKQLANEKVQVLDRIITYNGTYWCEYEKTKITIAGEKRDGRGGGYHDQDIIEKDRYVLKNVYKRNSYRKMEQFFAFHGGDELMIDPVAVLIELEKELELGDDLVENEHRDKVPDPSTIDGIKLVNDTKFPHKIQQRLEADLEIPALDLNSNEPQVLIYHTHTNETYTGSQYSADPSHSDDQETNIVAVGKRLKEHLNAYGINVIHSTQDHSSAASPYGSSLQTITSILNMNPSIKLVLDIHRDGLSGKPGDKLTTEKRLATGESIAQLMFVVGTNQRLLHGNWEQNFILALKLHKELANKNNGVLMRYTNLRQERFNQHVSNGALLVEVGADGDSLQAAKNSTKHLADAIVKVLNDMDSIDFGNGNSGESGGGGGGGGGGDGQEINQPR